MLSFIAELVCKSIDWTKKKHLGTRRSKALESEGGTRINLPRQNNALAPLKFPHCGMEQFPAGAVLTAITWS
jgi:hypothetical protein